MINYVYTQHYEEFDIIHCVEWYLLA